MKQRETKTEDLSALLQRLRAATHRPAPGDGTTPIGEGHDTPTLHDAGT